MAAVDNRSSLWSVDGAAILSPLGNYAQKVKQVTGDAEKELLKWKSGITSDSPRLMLKAAVAFLDWSKAAKKALEQDCYICGFNSNDRLENEIADLGQLLAWQLNLESSYNTPPCHDLLLQKYLCMLDTSNPKTFVDTNMGTIAALVVAVSAQFLGATFVVSLASAAITIIGAHLLYSSNDVERVMVGETVCAIDKTFSQRDVLLGKITNEEKASALKSRGEELDQGAAEVKNWKEVGILSGSLLLMHRGLYEMFAFERLRGEYALELLRATEQDVSQVAREIAFIAKQVNLTEQKLKDVRVATRGWVRAEESILDDLVKQHNAEKAQAQAVVDRQTMEEAHRAESVSVAVKAAFVGALAAQFFAVPIMATLSCAAMASLVTHLGYETYHSYC